MAEKKNEDKSFLAGVVLFVLVASAIFVPTVLWTMSVENKNDERIRVRTLCEVQDGTFISSGNRCVAPGGFIEIEDKD